MSTVTNTEIQLSESSRQLLSDALVWDNHQCMPLRPEDEFPADVTAQQGGGL